ncbi:MAG: NMD3-related protein, partial [Candidatus Micrarchaeota archaeon]|nr:NMD3-related protein [Candidatus Micrarchaeota archaeon]
KSASPIFSPDFLSVEYETEYGRMTQPVLVLTEKCMCSECGRAGSQYFEAIIQLRGDPKRVEKMAEILIRRIESRSFIPKIEELKEGLDIYCGSRNEGIAALNSQKLGFVRTEKLAGERNGKRLYRTTLLVRL